METDEPQRTIPFQFQFEKSIPSQVKIAEWNPEKDLLAMVSDDSKIFLHRFNWQRLWTISSGKCVTSLCWRPDGKTIAVGFEDGSIAIHDVENGKLLRSLKYHLADVVCLNWEEDRQLHRDGFLNFSAYEDRTSRFFPPAPRAPQMPGVVSGDSSFLDEGENSLGELSNCSHQRFNILCSADKEGSICFSAFGIFPIGKINIHELSVPIHALDEQAVSQLQNAYILKIAMAQDLCRLLVMCSGELKQNDRSGNVKVDIEETLGLHYLVIDTSIFSKRKNELHQVAQQASNIEDLTEVIRQSLSVMSKQWSDAMKTFREKFNLFATLISNHGLDSSPQEEFLSLLGGARTSQALHQYLVNSLGEAGVKRVSKAVCGTGKELQMIVLNHLQPAAEIIGFRIGELRGLSRWRARYHGIGLDEKLINTATEKSGMLLIQVERFMMVLSSVIQQFSNFFNWLQKCIKLLMQEQIDQPLSYNSELIVVFLKFLYDQDPVKELLELSKVDHDIQIELEMSQKVSELVQLGGFSDCDFLRRTLAKEFQQTESSFKEALRMPSKTISGKVLCVEVLPLVPIPLSTRSITIPMSVSFYKDASVSESDESSESGYIDYAAFHILDKAFPDISNCISIVRGVAQNSSNLKKGNEGPLEAALLSIPDHYHCVDLCLYKESELVLLLNETATNSEASGEACMVILRTSDLPFVPFSTSTSINGWKMDQLKGSVVYLEVESEKFRKVPNNVVAPLAVSASRGVACVFSSRKRALVYILEEDEEEDEEVSGSE